MEVKQVQQHIVDAARKFPPTIKLISWTKDGNHITTVSEVTLFGGQIKMMQTNKIEVRGPDWYVVEYMMQSGMYGRSEKRNEKLKPDAEARKEIEAVMAGAEPKEYGLLPEDLDKINSSVIDYARRHGVK